MEGVVEIDETGKITDRLKMIAHRERPRTHTRANKAPSETEEITNIEVPEQSEMETSAPEVVDTPDEAVVDTPSEAMKEETPE